jgi:hypothetical protein
MNNGSLLGIVGVYHIKNTYKDIQSGMKNTEPAGSQLSRYYHVIDWPVTEKKSNSDIIMIT